MARSFLGLVLVAVMVATLAPNRSAHAIQQVFCTICGPRGLADALLNVILFTPVGLALVLTGASFRRAVLIGATLSFGIEVAQIVIPGRDPSLGDVIMNTVGTALGAYISAHRSRWLAPPGRLASRFSLAAAAAAVLVLIATGYLLAPSYTDDEYYGFWTPQLGHLEWYRGQVLEAHVGDIPLIHGKLSESRRIRDLLVRGAPMEVKAIAGPPVSSLGGLVAIGDSHYRFNVLVGPDRNDLVFEHRTRSEATGFDLPDIRLTDAMKAISPGDTLSFRLWMPNRRFCIQLNSVRQCDLGYGTDSGWRILYSGNDLSARARSLVGFGWIVLIVGPFAFWARTSWPSAAGAAFVLFAFLFAAPWSGLIPLEPTGWIAVIVGLVVGVGSRLMVARFGSQPAVSRSASAPA